MPLVVYPPGYVGLTCPNSSEDNPKLPRVRWLYLTYQEHVSQSLKPEEKTPKEEV